MRARSSLLALAACLALTPISVAYSAEVLFPLKIQLPMESLAAWRADALVRADTRSLCPVTGAEAEAIERDTSDPCLAADSTPGGVCFERLGRIRPRSGTQVSLHAAREACLR